MKPAFVADLKPDTAVTSFFLVSEKELRSTREGKPFLRLELSDRTGTVEARLWENAEELSAAFAQSDIVKVQARVESFRNKLQLSIDRLRRAEPAEVELADYFPHTSEDVEELYKRLTAHAAAVGNPWLNRLLKTILDDPAIAPRFKRAPAAKVMHHAYLGGLLEHVVSLCELCKLIAGHYRELDLDMLITGAILHDIGKLDELCYERAIHYSTEGHLLGHIVMEVEQVGRVMDAIPGFPAELKTLLKHVLISHHGQYEFGSPKLPMTREALVFSFLDDLDSKMNATRAALAADSGDELWSAYVHALGRKFLRAEVFGKEDRLAVQEPESLTLTAKAGSAPLASGALKFGNPDANPKSPREEE
jgi:3'-5' exoribonuclease